MRKFTFSFKSLLVAAGLIMGSASAWGATKTLYSQNFNSESGVPTGWIQASGTLSLEVSGGNKWLRETTAGTGSRSAWYTGMDIKNAISTYTSYVLEFDCLIKEGTYTTNYSQGVWVTGSNLDHSWGAPTGYAIGVKKGSNETTYTIQANAASTSETVNLTTNTWYHYVCAYDHTTKKITFSILSQDQTSTIYAAHEFDYDYSGDGKGVFQSIHFQSGRGDGYTELDNILLTTEVNEEVVSDPSIALTAVSGDNRIVTITGGTSSDGTATVTTYYTTDGSDPTSSSSVYSSALTITENSTVKAISISDKGGVSNISSLAVTTGAVTLNAPTYTKTAYSAGVSAVTLSCNQSDITLSPTATIHWSAGANSGDVASGTSVNVNDGETLEAYCVADGYANSSTLSVTATPYVGATVWTENYTGINGGKITLGDEIETGLYKMLASDGTIIVSEYLLTYNVNIDNYFLLRNSTCPGIYSGSGRSYAITGLAAGQHVVITTNNGSETATVNAGTNLTKDVWETWPGHFAFDVTANGTATFSINRYCSVASVTVYSSILPVEISAAGWATFSSDYALDLDNMEGGSAFIVEAGAADAVDGYITLTTQTGTVAAHTGLILKSEGGAEGPITIPVVASGTDISSTNKLVAVTANSTAVAINDYILGCDNEYKNVGLYKLDEATTLNKGQAYLPAGFNNAKALRFVLPGETPTKVVAPEVADVEEEEVLYNMAGVRVDKNFKGFVVNQKGEKRFNK